MHPDVPGEVVFLIADNGGLPVGRQACNLGVAQIERCSDSYGYRSDHH